MAVKSFAGAIETRFHGPDRDIERERDLVDRHAFDVMENDHILVVCTKARKREADMVGLAPGFSWRGGGSLVRRREESKNEMS